MDPNVTQALDVDPNRTQMSSGPSLNVTQTIQPVQCPICKTFNPAGEGFCIECGLIFESALPEDAFGAPAVRPPCLVDESGREHFLRPGANLVGREGDIMLQDSNVSRKHAEITLDGGSVVVRDLGSTNGTFFNGERLGADESIQLAPGDKIEFAGNSLTLVFPEGMGTPGKTQMISEAPAERQAVAMLKTESAEFRLLEGANTVGRRSDNDIALDDPYCSGAHGIIECESGDFYFTDLGSTNGTFLNGAKMLANERVRISPDDELVIGQTQVSLTLLSKNIALEETE